MITDPDINEEDTLRGILGAFWKKQKGKPKGYNMSSTSIELEERKAQVEEDLHRLRFIKSWPGICVQSASLILASFQLLCCLYSLSTFKFPEGSLEELTKWLRDKWTEDVSGWLITLISLCILVEVHAASLIDPLFLSLKPAKRMAFPMVALVSLTITAFQQHCKEFELNLTEDEQNCLHKGLYLGLFWIPWASLVITGMSMRFRRNGIDWFSRIAVYFHPYLFMLLPKQDAPDSSPDVSRRPSSMPLFQPPNGPLP